jgi:hypothetical protein
MRFWISTPGLLFVFVGCFSSVTAGAQDGLSTWSIANARVQVAPRWAVWGELQLRSLSFYDQFNYHETKGGLQYNLGNSGAVLVGFGRYVTYSPGDNFASPIVNDELRTWLQFSMENRFGKLHVEHRYRLEQRWTSVGYRNRFRYRLNVLLPLNKAVVKKGTFYLNGWDEIFLTDLQPHFERNRPFIGLGYEVTDPFTIQVSYLSQYDFQLAVAPLTRNFLQTSLLLDIQTKRSSRERHPSTVD